MRLPLKTFWLLSQSVERIRAEENLCDLVVAGSAQSPNGYESTWKRLSKQVGTTVDIDKVWVAMNEEKDVAGVEELKRLAG